jgi:hypothetical protein
METDMDWRLSIASIITLAIAVAHSALGERRIIAPLLNTSFDFCRPERVEFTRLTLRFAWHLTSLFMLGCAVLLLVFSISPIDLASILALEVMGAVFVAAAAITGSYSRGRHVAWPLFAIAGSLCWWTAVRHEGPVSFDLTKREIGFVASAILLLAGSLHLYWAARGSTDLVAVIPEKDGKPLFRPRRIGTFVVAIGLVLAGLLVAEQAADLLHLGLPEATRIGCWPRF